MPIGNVIEKETVPDYHIVPAFVDKSDYWQNELQYAARLGNEFKGKTMITFETTQGPKTIITTVWSVTEDYLQIKGGYNIPIRSIIDIHY
ncbi:MAG: hypothetical protein H6551_06895 [Chitinophagales bacterium]|nr:hypothetical protein [Chitinophagaceae bacterium]MCB9064858.1 hypothetical protein [Chitinophagales bacterium]